MAQPKSEDFTVVFDVTGAEWDALRRRGAKNTRWPEQEAGNIVRRAIRRELRTPKGTDACTA